LREGWIAGSVASATSTVALAAAGKWCNGSWSAPINAVSHWAWDRKALMHHRPSVAYTVVGYAIHHLASVFWATLQAAAREKLSPGAPPTAAGAALTGAVAALVDLRLTPRRLTPGFDHKVPTAALVAVYACFAVGLLAGARAAHRQSIPRRQARD
jgi:hypothetical protein